MKKLHWWFKPPNQPIYKVRTAVAITVLLIALTTVAALAAEYFINLEGQVEEINDALFIGFFPDTPTGTGNFDPFLRISQSNLAVVKGFNTDAAPQFQEDDTWTTAQNISEIPVIAFEYPEGTIRLYRELQLDINQNASVNGKYLSLDVIEIYITKDPNLTGYDPTTKFGTNATLVYDMDEFEDNWLKFDYTNNNGSGKRDMKMLIPNEWLTEDPRCAYTGPVPAGSPPSDCPYYFVMYNEFGSNYENNDGFEEWGSEIYPVASKTGYKYNDLNKNGDRDEGEPGLEGWTIYLDLNNDGNRDPGEPFAVTGADGYYEIKYIIPNPTPDDTWIDREEQQTGWLCSEPAGDPEDCYYDENFAANETKSGNDFENYQPSLDVTKTADTALTRTYTWDITKDYDATYSMFIGDPATTHSYEITVNRTGFVDSGWIVSGEILIENNEPIAATISGVSDVLDDGTPVTVDCGVTFPHELAAGDSLTCSYTASPEGTDATENEATVTTSGTVAGGSDTEAVNWGTATITEVNATVNVTDDYGTADTGDDLTFGPLGDGDTVGYDRDYLCSSDPADYEGGLDSYFVNNIATIDETGDWDDATVTVNCYIPSISKTAAGTYDERHEWTVLKEVDPLSQSAFIGDTVTFDWTITVDEEVFEENFDVAGTITVNNPNPDDALVVSLVDSVNGNAVTITGCTGGTFSAGTLTVPAGGTAVCSYEANNLPYTALADAPGMNYATITLNGIDFDASDPIEYTVNVIRGTATLDDDQYPYSGESVYDGWTSTYEDSYTCSTDLGDYSGGADLDNQVSNTAIVYSGGAEEDRSTATTEIDCYAPVLDKDAFTNWEKKYDWTITKDYDYDYKGLIGDPAIHHWYTVAVDQTITDQNFKVYGSIYVSNPAGSPGDMIVSLADELATGVFATVDCGSGATSVTVAPGATESCSYSGYLAAKTDGTNKATGSFNGIDGFEATEPYAFGEPTIIGYPEIDVYDQMLPNGGFVGHATGDDSWTYYRAIWCGYDPSKYVDGVWDQGQMRNVAYIEQTGQEDDATISLICYAPVLTKDASASYDERHIWDVVKTVNPESQGGFPGDVLPWTWTVVVSEDFVEENFAVSGKINVANPVGSPGNMTVSLVDQLNDGTFATVDCGSGATSITVAPGSTGTCDYTADPDGRTATLNTATGTLDNYFDVNFTATYPVSFEKNVVKGTATVTDTEIGLDEPLTAGDGPWTYTKDYDHTCSSDRADYFVDGVYTQMTDTIVNWAYVYSDGVKQDEDDATTTWTCDASFVDIIKTTNGSPDPTRDIRFKLYDGNGVDLNDEVSTLGAEGGLLHFSTALVPGDPYTICESPVPSGYTFEVRDENGNVVTPIYPGPPGAENPTGEIQCFDFIAGDATTTRTFSINNSYPGGAPRTPGYWKNWNTCTDGNQAATAAALGGPDANVFLLDDLLPQIVGDFSVETCEIGVLVLDSRTVDTEEQMSNDGAYVLARNLLAARLNLSAGACEPDGQTWEYNGDTLNFDQVLTAADELLSTVGFDGTGSYLGPKDKGVKKPRNDALYLAGIIDDYNNQELCTGTPSH